MKQSYTTETKLIIQVAFVKSHTCQRGGGEGEGRESQTHGHAGRGLKITTHSLFCAAKRNIVEEKKAVA